MKYFVADTEDGPMNVLTRIRSRLRGSFVKLSDGVTHYELTGPDDGEIVMLAGGLTIPLFYWDRMAAELHERGLRTLTYSAYGRGYSDRVRGPYDEALFVRQLSELIESLSVPKPYHLVGTSMGALVAMAYARENSVNLVTLSLIGPAGLSPQPFAQKIALGNDWTAGLIARHLGSRVLKQHLGHNLSDQKLTAELSAMVLDSFRYDGSLYAFFDTLQHFPLFDRSDAYHYTGTLQLPVSLVWGTEDRVTPISSLETVRGLLRPSHCHVIENCGHMAPFEKPSIVANSVASHIDSYSDRRPR
ncbi:alpha/beta fold hydrolase [Nocardia sp. NPDC055002]